MEGIEILSKKIVYETTWKLTGWVIIGFIFACVIAIAFIKMGFDNDSPLLGTLGAVLCLACLVMMFVGIYFFNKPTEKIDHIEYKVTIDDTVSLTEFNDKYKIIKQEGKIYTIIEKPTQN